MRHWLVPLFALGLAAGGANASVCIPIDNIDHTGIVDDQTVLFTMKDGQVWENLLPEACPGLKARNRFEFTGLQPQLCENIDIVRISDIEPGCALGTFVLYEDGH